ncbi:MAG TPA: MauE/DoxX family redox-associated membrane protein [Candidatus Binatia bacterium]|nr:MauE/DoxX family redox-associated membrane protein [Candidatus Binatia bacterium]
MDAAAATILRASLVLLLGSAALHKLRDPLGFRLTLQAYELVPQPFLIGAAGAVILLELVLTTWLASGIALAGAGAAAAALLLAYAAAIGVNVRRGRLDIDCGCAGPASRVPLSSALVVRNLIVAAAAALLIVPTNARTITWIDALTISAGIASLSASWLAAQRMLALAPALSRLRQA